MDVKVWSVSSSQISLFKFRLPSFLLSFYLYLPLTHQAEIVNFTMIATEPSFPDISDPSTRVRLLEDPDALPLPLLLDVMRAHNDYLRARIEDLRSSIAEQEQQLQTMADLTQRLRNESLMRETSIDDIMWMTRTPSQPATLRALTSMPINMTTLANLMPVIVPRRPDNPLSPPLTPPQVERLALAVWLPLCLQFEDEEEDEDDEKDDDEDDEEEDDENEEEDDKHEEDNDYGEEWWKTIDLNRCRVLV
jgi:hypothetical protein